MKTPPQWAQELLLAALLWWEEQGHKDAPLPELRWRKARRTSSSGQGCAAYLSVSAGTDRTSAKLTLLHELAHALVGFQAGKGRNLWHSPQFWDCAWSLYRWAGLPLRFCRQREGSYRQGALAGYRRGLLK